MNELARLMTGKIWDTVVTHHMLDPLDFETIEKIIEEGMREALKEWQEALLDTFTQGCGKYVGDNDEGCIFEFDTLGLSAYHYAQCMLIEAGMIKEKDCIRR